MTTPPHEPNRYLRTGMGSHPSTGRLFGSAGHATDCVAGDSEKGCRWPANGGTGSRDRTAPWVAATTTAVVDARTRSETEVDAKMDFEPVSGTVIGT